MVFAINPSPGALDAYRAAARNTGTNNSPPPSSPQSSPQPQPQPAPPTTATVTVGGGVTTIVTQPQPSPNPQQPPNGNTNNASPSSSSGSPSPIASGNIPSGTSVSPSSPSAEGTSLSSHPGAPDRPYEHLIGVGVDGLLTFSPARIQALVGDVVTFDLRSEKHSVAQSSFNNPCQPLVKDDGSIGFRSGVYVYEMLRTHV
jgi:plastocyanin